jgi:hypothetical protein
VARRDRDRPLSSARWASAVLRACAAHPPSIRGQGSAKLVVHDEDVGAFPIDLFEEGIEHGHAEESRHDEIRLILERPPPDCQIMKRKRPTWPAAPSIRGSYHP